LHHAEVVTGQGGYYAMWDGWLRRCDDYQHIGPKARGAWNGFSRSDGEVVTVGTIFWLANEANPGWSNELDERIAAEINAANAAASAAMHATAVEQEPERAADAEAADVEAERERAPGGADGGGNGGGNGGSNGRAPRRAEARAEAREREEARAEQTEPRAEVRARAERSTAPVDLWAKFEPPPLPAHLLPRTIAGFAIEQGELIGADPAGRAVAALAGCAASVRDQIKIKVKRYGGWMESARLWVALVGLASYKKTPIIAAAAKPIVDIDVKMYRAYAEAKARWDALPSDERRTTPRPKQVRIRLEDTTVEAAQEVLRDSPSGGLCLHDELSGWFGSMDKYAGHRGAAKDRGFWLQSYNGGSYVFDRVSRGSGLVENLSVSLLGGIQPETMRKISADTVDDGLIQRIVPNVLGAVTTST